MKIKTPERKRLKNFFKKRITITLDPDIRFRAIEWEWRRISWSHEINMALKLLYNTFDNSASKILKGQTNEK